MTKKFPIKSIHEIFTAAEADEKWGLPSGAVRQSCNRGKLREFIDECRVRKSGNTWLVDAHAMIQTFGWPFSPHILQFISYQAAYGAVCRPGVKARSESGILLNFFETSEEARDELVDVFSKNVENVIQKKGYCEVYTVRTKYGWNGIDPAVSQPNAFIEERFGDRALEVKRYIAKIGFSTPSVSSDLKTYTIKHGHQKYVFTYHDGVIDVNINDEIARKIRNREDFAKWVETAEYMRYLSEHHRIVLQFNGDNPADEDDVARNTSVYIDDEYVGSLDNFTDPTGGKVNDFANSSEVDTWIEGVINGKTTEIEKYIQK